MTETFSADEAVQGELLRLGFEGSVLKRRDGRYRPGERSSLWRRVKTRSQSEAVFEVVARDRSSGVIERVACRAVDDPARLTWAVSCRRAADASALTSDSRRPFASEGVISSDLGRAHPAAGTSGQ